MAKKDKVQEANSIAPTTLEEALTQIEALNADIDQLNEAADASKKEIDELNAELEASAEKLKAIEKSEGEKDAEIAEQEGIIADMSKKIEALSAQKNVADIVISNGGKKYKVAILKFSFNGEIKTAEDVKTDKALQTELLKQESGVLVEITQP